VRSNIPSRKLLVVLLAVGLVGSTVAFAATSTVAPSQDAEQDSTVAPSHEGDEQATTYVRVVHASPDAPAVDVRVENETVLSNVSFGDVSDYLELESGTYNVSIVTADEDETVVLDTNVTFEPRTVTTLAASGEISEDTDATEGEETNETESEETTTTESEDTNETESEDTNETESEETTTTESEETNETESEETTTTEGEETNETEGEDTSPMLDATLFNDNAFTPVNNSSAISVVHLSPDAPAVDVTAANGSVVLADNVTFQNASDYVTVPAGNYTVEVRAATAANNGSVVATADVSLERGQAYSALALGYVDAENAAADAPFEVALVEDATLTIQLPSADDPMNETTSNETTSNETTVPTTETTTPTPNVTIPENLTVSPNGSVSPPLP